MTYCEGLFTPQEAYSTVTIDVHEEEPEMLLSEVKNAMQKLKTNISPGIDDIPGELLKCTDVRGSRIMFKLCNKIWHTKSWPEDWKRSIFLALPKKGDMTECKNNQP